MKGEEVNEMKRDVCVCGCTRTIVRWKWSCEWGGVLYVGLLPLQQVSKLCLEVMKESGYLPYYTQNHTPSLRKKRGARASERETN